MKQVINMILLMALLFFTIDGALHVATLIFNFAYSIYIPAAMALVFIGGFKLGKSDTTKSE